MIDLASSVLLIISRLRRTHPRAVLTVSKSGS
jgi:hypothetical protein